MAGTTLRDAFIDEIKDLYHAEKQLLKALPKLAKGATNPKLRDALQSHLKETEKQCSRLEEVFDLMDEKVRAKKCAGMEGIIEEGADTLKEDFEDAVMDAAIIASAQRAEHYEIGAYGTAVAWAEALEMPEVARILNSILAEEKAADVKLSRLAEAGINEAAAAGEEAEDEEDEMPARTRPSSGSRSAKGRSASARKSGR
jgi:ferritin-like metal-binding protein YciE